MSNHEDRGAPPAPESVGSKPAADGSCHDATATPRPRRPPPGAAEPATTPAASAGCDLAPPHRRRCRTVADAPRRCRTVADAPRRCRTVAGPGRAPPGAVTAPGPPPSSCRHRARSRPRTRAAWRCHGCRRRFRSRAARRCNCNRAAAGPGRAPPWTAADADTTAQCRNARPRASPLLPTPGASPFALQSPTTPLEGSPRQGGRFFGIALVLASQPGTMPYNPLASISPDERSHCTAAGGPPRLRYKKDGA